MIDIGANFVSELYKSLGMFIPETVLVVTFVVAIIMDLIFRKYKNIAAFTVLAGFFVTGYTLFACNSSGYAFSQTIAINPFSQFFKFIILLTSIIIVIISFLSKELYAENRKVGEYYSMIAGMTFGMFLICSSTNLILIYLALETMSLSSYVLAGYTKEVKRSSEASLKYVIFGAISSGIMIYGISIIFGLTGSFDLLAINAKIATGNLSIAPLLVSGIMILAGIGYKISAAPFHFWTPDVYEGAPITITAYLSVASKAAGFAVLIRFVLLAFATPISQTQPVWQVFAGIDWKLVLAILSVLTMTLGNLSAIWQTNIKRLLAYSSIAHAGYMLMGLVIMTSAGVLAILVYFFMYMLMNLGAFYIVMLIANKTGSEEMDDYIGIGYRAPILAGCMVVFLLSLTGIPPTAGFIGKLYLFMAVIDARWIWLAVIGVLNSVVSLFYYVKVMRNMFIRGTDKTEEPLQFSRVSIVIALILAGANIYFGLWFEPIVRWVNECVKSLF
ncbi:MAG: dehydrogenase subunit [Ignavibacteria bacterium]|nr:dehydrogenase subunit [Ignavibacteria bacterium]